MEARILRATISISPLLLTPSSRQVNKSPPSRATVSTSRMQRFSRSAVATSTASPPSGPSCVLISWNRSNPNSTIPTSCFFRLAIARAWMRRSRSSARLASVVNGSYCAIYAGFVRPACDPQRGAPKGPVVQVFSVFLRSHPAHHAESSCAQTLDHAGRPRPR